MNATNYYVTACRLVIQANPDSLGSWQVGFFFITGAYKVPHPPPCSLQLNLAVQSPFSKEKGTSRYSQMGLR